MTLKIEQRRDFNRRISQAHSNDAISARLQRDHLASPDAPTPATEPLPEDVERVARALAKEDGIDVNNDASYRHSTYGPRARAAILALSQRPASTADRGEVEQMTQRFLAWKLPADFHPDDGISFDPIMNLGTEFQRRREPIGTNLFNYNQAKAMIEYLLATPTPAAQGEGER